MPKAILLLLVIAPLALADLTWERDTRLTGGTALHRLRDLQAAGDLEAPVPCTIRIHGHWLARRQGPVELIYDLDQRTVTTLNHERQTYSTVPFDQYRAEHAAPAVSGAPPDYTVTSSPSNETHKFQDITAPAVIIRVSVDEAGAASKHQPPIEFAADVAYSGDDPGWPAAAAAARKLAGELGVDLLAPDLPIALKPVAREALRRVAAETLKLSGGVLEEELRIDGPLSAVIEAKALTKAAKQQAERQAGQAALSKLGRGLGSVLSGGAGGVISSGPAGNVPVPDKTPVPSIGRSRDENQPASNSTALLEVTVETTNFANTDLADSAFAIPSGYTQVSAKR
jgi:hypothetical protein